MRMVRYACVRLDIDKAARAIYRRTGTVSWACGQITNLIPTLLEPRVWKYGYIWGVYVEPA